MDEEDDEPLDPRIQNELEKLNKAALLINKLENDLDDARSKFRTSLSDSTQQLEALAKKFGGSIEKAKPYYDSRLKATEIQSDTQKAAVRYERACAMQAAAREMVDLAEQGYEHRTKRVTFDTAWQEMLNHATIRVMDAENERLLSQKEHKNMIILCAQVQSEVDNHYKDQKRNIARSKPYFEMKANLHSSLEKQKQAIERIQKDIETAKKLYSKTLSTLDAISQEIHNKRNEKKQRKSLGKRESGVGSETPPPAPFPKENSVDYKEKGLDEIMISFPPNKTPENTEKEINSNELPVKLVKPIVTIEISVPEQAIDKLDGLYERNKIIEESGALCSQVDSVLEQANNKLEGFYINKIIEETENEKKTKVHRTQSDMSVMSCRDVRLSPVVMRHRRNASGTFQLSAKKLLEEAIMSDNSDTNSVNSFVVLDDEGVANAMSEQYFSGYYATDLHLSTHEDYSKLPESLSHFQRPYEQSRKSLTIQGADFKLKLDHVLKLLDNSHDESAV